MLLNDFIATETIACQESASSKKRALEKVSYYLALGQAGLNETAIFDKLLERERLGSTGLGNGVAIPHCRMAGVKHAVVALITLNNRIDFDAGDRQPVDILFALLVPETCTETHLKILATAAEMLSNADFCQLLRDSRSNTELYELLVNWRPAALPA